MLFHSVYKYVTVSAFTGLLITCLLLRQNEGEEYTPYRIRILELKQLSLQRGHHRDTDLSDQQMQHFPTIWFWELESDKAFQSLATVHFKTDWMIEVSRLWFSKCTQEVLHLGCKKRPLHRCSYGWDCGFCDQWMPSFPSQSQFARLFPNCRGVFAYVTFVCLVFFMWWISFKEHLVWLMCIVLRLMWRSTFWWAIRVGLIFHHIIAQYCPALISHNIWCSVCAVFRLICQGQEKVLTNLIHAWKFGGCWQCILWFWFVQKSHDASMMDDVKCNFSDSVSGSDPFFNDCVVCYFMSESRWLWCYISCVSDDHLFQLEFAWRWLNILNTG